jgi:hypothetical protein
LLRLCLLDRKKLLLLLDVLRLAMRHLLLHVHHIHGPHSRILLHRSHLSCGEPLGTIW